mmetsp:Transcript_41739/g.105230  ORF Transcript_41739/g.105230 Transcript_41739/m.105230 type:complete len:214 (+) Transcript_41739:606-1247(+)
MQVVGVAADRLQLAALLEQGGQRLGEDASVAEHSLQKVTHHGHVRHHLLHERRLERALWPSGGLGGRRGATGFGRSVCGRSGGRHVAALRVETANLCRRAVLVVVACVAAVGELEADGRKMAQMLHHGLPLGLRVHRDAIAVSINVDHAHLSVIESIDTTVGGLEEATELLPVALFGGYAETTDLVRKVELEGLRISHCDCILFFGGGGGFEG